jgi:hypothetical protein
MPVDVKEIATGEVNRVKALSIEAAKSKAYLYPIKVSSDGMKFHMLEQLD